MHFGIQYEYRFTKQYNKLCSHSLLEIPDIFGLFVVQETVACTSSGPPLLPIANSLLHPTRHTYHPAKIFSSAVNSKCVVQKHCFIANLQASVIVFPISDVHRQLFPMGSR